MAPKRKADSSDGSASKKRKAITTMEVKLDIIKQSKNGETLTNIGQSLGLSLKFRLHRVLRTDQCCKSRTPVLSTVKCAIME